MPLGSGLSSASVLLSHDHGLKCFCSRPQDTCHLSHDHPCRQGSRAERLRPWKGGTGGGDAEPHRPYLDTDSAFSRL